MTASGDYIGTTALRERGWTEAAIKRFLGEPDKRVPNPMYKSAAPARLYRADRASLAEASDEWKAWRQVAGKRSARSKAIASAKRAELLREVDALHISVPVMDPGDLARKAVRHRNTHAANWAADRGDISFDADVSTADQVTLDRWTVNYLRHRHTSYDDDLSGMYGRVGRAEAQEAIRLRVYAVIARTYPSLTKECDRQLADRSQKRPSA